MELMINVQCAFHYTEIPALTLLLSLRSDAPLLCRIDYLMNANLFADDAKKEHDASERKKMKEALMANREKAADNGSDLGLWGNDDYKTRLSTR